MTDAAPPIPSTPARHDRLRRDRVWAALVASAVALAAPSAQAQQPAASGPSFEASLKKFCPAKNLEFLKPDILAKTTDAFVDQLPPEQNKRVKDLSRPGVEACSGSADEACRTAAILGTIRFTGLSEDLARRFCALPLACQDWFNCTEVAEAPQAAPDQQADEQRYAQQNEQANRQARGDQPARQDEQASQAQQARPKPPEPDDQTAALSPRPPARSAPPAIEQPPPAPLERPRSGEPAPQDDDEAGVSADSDRSAPPPDVRRRNDYARGPDVPETAVPPRRPEPALPPLRAPEARQPEARQPETRQAEPRYAGPIAPSPLPPAPPPEAGASDGRSVVAGFYNALGRADGIDAARYLIPSKRGRGPFSVAAMERFYGGLLQPLRLMDVQQIGPSTLRARYSFVTRDRAVCNGDAIVAVRPSPEGALIESIRALSGC